MSGQTDGGAFPPPGGGGFLGPPTTAQPTALTTSGPPLAYLAISTAAVACAALLLLTVRDQPWASLLAWLLAGPVNVVVIGAFLGTDNRRKADSLYMDPGWPRVAYKVLLLLGMAVAIAASWFFADWVGRR